MLTENQRAVADAAGRLDKDTSLHGMLSKITDIGTAQDTLDSLSGEVHASVATALITESRFVRDAIKDRIGAAAGDRSWRVGVLKGVDQANGEKALQQPGDSLEYVLDKRTTLWGRVFDGGGYWQGHGNAAGLNRQSGGLLVGADLRLAPDWRLGFGTGYSRTDFDVGDRDSQGVSDSYHLGLYTHRKWGATRLRAGAAYTRHTIETQRTAVTNTGSDALHAGYRATTLQGFGELGYRFTLGRARLQPSFGLDYVHFARRSFRETGGAAALFATAEDVDAAWASVVLKSAGGLRLKYLRGALHGAIGLQRAVGDHTPIASQRLAQGEVFKVSGTPLREKTGFVSASAKLDVVGDIGLDIQYKSRYGKGDVAHTASATMSMRF